MSAEEARLRASRQINRAFWEHYYCVTIAESEKPDAFRASAASEYVWYWYLFVPLRAAIEEMYGCA